jgi:hypothetical protein
MTTTQVAKSFITTQLYFETEPGVEATWDDLPVPGIGPDKGQPGLDKFGITNAAQIVGYFLQAAKGDEKAMADFLITHGCSTQHVPRRRRAGADLGPVLRRSQFSRIFGLNRMAISKAAEFGNFANFFHL